VVSVVVGLGICLCVLRLVSLLSVLSWSNPETSKVIVVMSEFANDISPIMKGTEADKAAGMSPIVMIYSTGRFYSYHWLCCRFCQLFLLVRIPVSPKADAYGSRENEGILRRNHSEQSAL
jgi:hypothetical protein